MDFIKKNGSGILVCLAIAIPSWLLGKMFPVSRRRSDCHYSRNDCYNVLGR